MEFLILTITLTILAIATAILAFRYRSWLSGNRGALLATAATVFFVLAFLVLFYRPPRHRHRCRAADSIQPPGSFRRKKHTMPILSPVRGLFESSRPAAGGEMPALS